MLDATLIESCFDILATALPAAKVRLLIGKTDAYEGTEVSGLWADPSTDKTLAAGGQNAGFTAQVHVKYANLPTMDEELKDGDKVEIITASTEANKVRRIAGIRELGRDQTTGKPAVLVLTLVDEYDT